MIAGEKYIKDGQEKTKWIELGVIMSKDGKEFVLMDKRVNLAAFESLPGKHSVICSVFEDTPQGQQQGYNQAPQQQYQQPQQQYQQPQQQQQQQYQQPSPQNNQQGAVPQFDADGNQIPFSKMRGDLYA